MFFVNKITVDINNSWRFKGFVDVHLEVCKEILQNYLENLSVSSQIAWDYKELKIPVSTLKFQEFQSHFSQA